MPLYQPFIHKVKQRLKLWKLFQTEQEPLQGIVNCRRLLICRLILTRIWYLFFTIWSQLSQRSRVTSPSHPLSLYRAKILRKLYQANKQNPRLHSLWKA